MFTFRLTAISFGLLILIRTSYNAPATEPKNTETVALGSSSNISLINSKSAELDKKVNILQSSSHKGLESSPSIGLSTTNKPPSQLPVDNKKTTIKPTTNTGLKTSSKITSNSNPTVDQKSIEKSVNSSKSKDSIEKNKTEELPVTPGPKDSIPPGLSIDYGITTGLSPLQPNQHNPIISNTNEGQKFDAIPKNELENDNAFTTNPENNKQGEALAPATNPENDKEDKEPVPATNPEHDKHDKTPVTKPKNDKDINATATSQTVPKASVGLIHDSSQLKIENQDSPDTVSPSAELETLEDSEVQDPVKETGLNENDDDDFERNLSEPSGNTLEESKDSNDPLKNPGNNVLPVDGILETPEGKLPAQETGLKDTPKFLQQEDNHFFAYFVTAVVVFALGYLIVHNKQKILAIIVEGRTGRRRRSHVYRKLTNEKTGNIF